MIALFEGLPNSWSTGFPMEPKKKKHRKNDFQMAGMIKIIKKEKAPAELTKTRDTSNHCSVLLNGHFDSSRGLSLFSVINWLSLRKRSRQTSCLAIIRFSPFSRQWQYKGNNERTKNMEIFTRTWVWGLVLRECVPSVLVWNVRVTSSACIYQLLWWVRALCALKQCTTGHKRFLFT